MQDLIGFSLFDNSIQYECKYYKINIHHNEEGMITNKIEFKRNIYSDLRNMYTIEMMKQVSKQIARLTKIWKDIYKDVINRRWENISEHDLGFSDDLFEFNSWGSRNWQNEYVENHGAPPQPEEPIKIIDFLAQVKEGEVYPALFNIEDIEKRMNEPKLPKEDKHPVDQGEVSADLSEASLEAAMDAMQEYEIHGEGIFTIFELAGKKDSD